MFAEANGDGTLSIDVEPLRKILQLEQKKGFLDSAVIGGLDKFLSNWVGRAMQSSADPHLLKQLQKLHTAKTGRRAQSHSRTVRAFFGRRTATSRD